MSNTLLTNTDPDSKKDGKKLKSIMITDDEWDLLVDLTEVLSIFADATTELGGSNYVTSSLRVRMLIEIIKTLTTRSSNQQTYIDELEVMKVMKKKTKMMILINLLLLLVYLMQSNQNYI